ncbi:Phytanoyl-CoA dioxygenase [Penicillium sp. IBT 18751x]|nr:Phytanoyl-CoA dioxygenase [Penicillium sp. IBT 18751x]
MVGVTADNLAVNDGPLTSENAAFLRPSEPTLPIEELRKRFEKDGYLFLKQVLPRADVLEARNQYFSSLQSTGVLKPGTAPVEGIFDPAKNHLEYPGIGAGHVDGNGKPGGDQAAQFVDLALDAHYQEWYAEKFCHHPALHEFIVQFSGWEKNTLSLRRTLLRNNIPGSKPIGVHYDQIFLRYGDPTSITAWVPMGDIKLNGGGLIYLEDGDSIGIEMEQAFFTKAKQAGLSDEEAKSAFNSNMMATGLLSETPAQFALDHGRKWLVSAYEAGDVVLHKPHMIHASTINNDPDNVIRLATDLRFCDSSKPYDKRWMNHYTFNDGV